MNKKFRISILIIIIIIGFFGILYYWWFYGRAGSDCNIKDINKACQTWGGFTDECYRTSAYSCGKIEFCELIENTMIKNICECQTMEALKNKDLCNIKNNESEWKQCDDYVYGKCYVSDTIGS